VCGPTRSAISPSRNGDSPNDAAVAHSGGQPDLAVSRASYATAASFGLSPFLLGLIADRVGPHTAFLLVPAYLAGAAALAWRLRRDDRPGHPKVPQAGGRAAVPGAGRLS